MSMPRSSSKKEHLYFDERDAWSEHQPSAQEQNEFIRLHGFAEYGKWYLGINDEKLEDTKGHYEFSLWGFQKSPPQWRTRGPSALTKQLKRQHEEIYEVKIERQRSQHCLHV
jgi:hypothetical protein